MESPIAEVIFDAAMPAAKLIARGVLVSTFAMIIRRAISTTMAKGCCQWAVTIS